MVIAMSASIQSRPACPSTGSPRCTSWYVMMMRMITTSFSSRRETGHTHKHTDKNNNSPLPSAPPPSLRRLEPTSSPAKRERAQREREHTKDHPPHSTTTESGTPIA